MAQARPHYKAVYSNFMEALEKTENTNYGKAIVEGLKLQSTLSNPKLALTVFMPEDRVGGPGRRGGAAGWRGGAGRASRIAGARGAGASGPASRGPAPQQRRHTHWRRGSKLCSGDLTR